MAEKLAENARAERERSTETANIVVPAQIAKQKLVIEAEAEAERIRLNAKGEADAIFAKMDAEARGLFAILTNQARGYADVVKAAGGDPDKAYQLLMIEKLPDLVKTQVEAVKNLKIDKVTVWDSGNGSDGKNSTANFMSGLLKTIPPLDDLFKSAGMNLPSFLKGPETAEYVQEVEEDKEVELNIEKPKKNDSEK